MTIRRKKQQRLGRAISGVAAASVFALITSQVVAQSQAQSCGAGHGTVAAASSQQYQAAVSAARAGNPSAMVEVAQMYRDGLGVARNLVLAQAWSDLATQNGAAATHVSQTISGCLTQAELRLANAKVLALLQDDEEEQESW